jgi:hypothetical protein
MRRARQLVSIGSRRDTATAPVAAVKLLIGQLQLPRVAEQKEGALETCELRTAGKAVGCMLFRAVPTGPTPDRRRFVDRRIDNRACRYKSRNLWHRVAFLFSLNLAMIQCKLCMSPDAKPSAHDLELRNHDLAAHLIWSMIWNFARSSVIGNRLLSHRVLFENDLS